MSRSLGADMLAFVVLPVCVTTTSGLVGGGTAATWCVVMQAVVLGGTLWRTTGRRS